MPNDADYITVVHDLDAKRLLFATPGVEERIIWEWIRVGGVLAGYT